MREYVQDRIQEKKQIHKNFEFQFLLDKLYRNKKKKIERKINKKIFPLLN